MLHHTRRSAARWLAALLLVLLAVPRSAGPGLAWDPPTALDDASDPRPRFLYFHAEWCTWCRRFEEQTLRHPEVAKRLAGHYRPVRADADLDRALFRRHGGRGLPYVVLLTPDGKTLGSFTGILAPEPFLDWLDRATGSEPPPELPVDPDTFHTALDELWDPAAERFHGVSLTGIEGTKRPQPLTARYLLEACFQATSAPCPDPVWKVRLPRLLDRMLLELEDPVEGGFFFYADALDEGHTETAKRLERNVRMTGLYLAACRILAEPRYCAAARRGLGYLDRTLWDEAEGAYRLGQHSDGAYYRLAEAARHARPAPAVDPGLDTAANAQALILLLEATRHLQDPSADRHAARTLHWLTARAAREDGAYRAHLGPQAPEAPGPLYTQVWVAAALHAALQAQPLPRPATTTPIEPGALQHRLHKLLRYLARFHYDPAAQALSEEPANRPPRYTHPASSGLLALLLEQLPAHLRPSWTDSLLPGLLAQIRWRPGIELDDLVHGVLAQRLRGAGHETSGAPPPRME